MRVHISKLTIFSFMTFVVMAPSLKSFAEDRGSGGGNNVAEIFSRSKVLIKSLLQRLNDKQISLVSENSQKYIREYKAQIAFELESEVVVDSLSESPFVHKDGSLTWIETDFWSGANIRIREKVMRNMIGELDTQKAVNYLCHEIGHHIFKGNEVKSWEIANAILEIYNSIHQANNFQLFKGECVSESTVMGDLAWGRIHSDGDLGSDLRHRQEYNDIMLGLIRNTVSGRERYRESHQDGYDCAYAEALSKCIDAGFELENCRVVRKNIHYPVKLDGDSGTFNGDAYVKFVYGISSQVGSSKLHQSIDEVIENQILQMLNGI